MSAFVFLCSDAGIFWDGSLQIMTYPTHKTSKLLWSGFVGFDTPIASLVTRFLCYDCVNKISPSCFHSFFDLVESVHRYGTRQVTKNDIFLTQKNTLQYGIRSGQWASTELNAGMTFLWI